MKGSPWLVPKNGGKEKLKWGINVTGPRQEIRKEQNRGHFFFKYLNQSSLEFLDAPKLISRVMTQNIFLDTLMTVAMIRIIVQGPWKQHLSIFLYVIPIKVMVHYIELYHVFALVCHQVTIFDHSHLSSGLVSVYYTWFRYVWPRVYHH